MLTRGSVQQEGCLLAVLLLLSPGSRDRPPPITPNSSQELQGAMRFPPDLLCSGWSHPSSPTVGISKSPAQFCHDLCSVPIWVAQRSTAVAVSTGDDVHGNHSLMSLWEIKRNKLIVTKGVHAARLLSAFIAILLSIPESV